MQVEPFDKLRRAFSPTQVPRKNPARATPAVGSRPTHKILGLLLPATHASPSLFPEHLARARDWDAEEVRPACFFSLPSRRGRLGVA